jgi:hypothetical protein
MLSPTDSNTNPNTTSAHAMPDSDRDC